jgi:hypothetical protein
MKSFRALWITPLFLAPLGCASQDHARTEEGPKAEDEVRKADETSAAGTQAVATANGTAPRVGGFVRTKLHALQAADFEDVPVGSLPPGWRIEGTSSKGTLASWAVRTDPSAPSPPNVLALTTANRDPAEPFNLCWTDQLRFRDGAITVSMKSVSGEEDQGGGLVWRVQDEDDYYLCRANPLEGNVRVYTVKGGVRSQIASADTVLVSGVWYTLWIEQQGSCISCRLDGRKLLEVVDTTFPDAGGVGVWTKSDAATEFDDIRVSELPPEGSGKGVPGTDR